jgi:hypothetical protein
MNAANAKAGVQAINWSDRANFTCRLCDCPDLRLYYTLGNDHQFRYYRCTSCGLVNYDLSGGTEQGQYTTIVVDPRDDTNSRNHDNDQAFLFLQKHVKTPGRLIDIGCGNGRLGGEEGGLEGEGARARRRHGALRSRRGGLRDRRQRLPGR